MTGRTHLLVGMAVGGLMVPSPIGMIVCGVGALLPDIDSPQSIISGWIPGGRLVGQILPHRGASHSLAALLGLAAVIMALAGGGNFLLLALAGYASHLLLDALTARGIPLLWPLEVRARMPLIWRVSGLVDGMLAIGALVVLGVTLWGM